MSSRYAHTVLGITLRGPSEWLEADAETGECPTKRERRGAGGWRRRLRRLLVTVTGLGTIVLLSAGALFAYAWNSLELPPEVPLSQTTFLTDVNGARLASFNGGENRVAVKLSEIPQVVRQAILDTEDHDFYQHRGVDPRGYSGPCTSTSRANQMPKAARRSPSNTAFSSPVSRPGLLSRWTTSVTSRQWSVGANTESLKSILL